MKTSSILRLVGWGLFIWGVVEFTLFWKPWVIGWSGYIAVILVALILFSVFMANVNKEKEKGN